MRGVAGQFFLLLCGVIKTKCAVSDLLLSQLTLDGIFVCLSVFSTFVVEILTFCSGLLC